MNIGIISDIHGRLSRDATDALSGCDHILCAGDCEIPDVLFELEGIAPVTAVLGNCDYSSYLTQELDPVARFNLAGIQFFMVHRPQDVRNVDDNVDVIIHGHTHIPRLDMIDGKLWINPGSPTKPRGGSLPLVAVMNADEGHIKDIEFITLS